MAAAAATERNSTEGVNKRSRKRGMFCFSLCCCEASNRVSAADGKVVKYGRYASARGKSKGLVAIDAALSEPVVSSRREIHVVLAEEGRKSLLLANSPAASEMLKNKANKDLNKVSEVLSPRIQNDNNKENRKVQEVRSKLSHSASLLQRKKDKRMAVNVHNIERESSETGELESMVGAVIVTMMLLVMLIWGKACAILCTVAWLYFIPRLRASMLESHATTTDDKNHGHHVVDLDSWEYKNRVVLQGLLERNIHH